MPLSRHILPFILLLHVAAASANGGSTSDMPQVLPGATTLEANRLEIYLERTMHAIGDAEMVQGTQTVFGDRIDYDVINQELHVLGNARVVQEGTVVSGPELRMQLEERRGEMKEPVFTMRKAPTPSGNAGAVASTARGDARRVTFDGPDRETLYGARYTTCDAGVDDWYLRASELELDHHAETGTARHASVEFKGVPILYTPWIDFPFNKQRKSGFLAPSWGQTTRSGFEAALPYYWNIGPNMDATITPRHMTKRGTQLQTEFRYLNENFSGEDNIEFLPNDDEAKADRYYYKLSHTHNFGGGWSGRLNYERVSDDDYFSDMSTSIISTSRINLPQEGRLNYSGEIWNFSAFVQQFQTLETGYYQYERMPQLTLTGSKDWSMAKTDMYAEWVRFDRDDKDPLKNLYATGNRFTVNPSISLPFGRSYGYITPKFGVHHTSYNLDRNNAAAGIDESASRTLPVFSLDSGLFFDRDFRVVKNMYTQTLEPRLFYVYIPYQDQSDMPVFDSGLADLNLSTLFSENQFTGNDRINNANQLSLALTSRLIDSKTGVQRLAATIGQRFYFKDQKVALNINPNNPTINNEKVGLRTSNSSDIIGALSARLLNKVSLDAGLQYNTRIDRTIRSNIGVRYNPEPGKVLNLSYRYTREDFGAEVAGDYVGLVGVEQIDLSSQWPLSPNWYAMGRINYSLQENGNGNNEGSGLIESLAGVEYDAGCWQARAVAQRVETATAQANYALFFQLELGGIASIGSNPLKLLSRSIPGYTNSSMLNNTLQSP